MQSSSEFQYLAIDTIHESTTNPRRTFDDPFNFADDLTEDITDENDRRDPEKCC